MGYDQPAMPPHQPAKNRTLAVPLAVILAALILGVILAATPGTLSTAVILGLATLVLPLAALCVAIQAWLALRRGERLLSAILFVLACLLLVLVLPMAGRLIEFLSAS